MAVARAPSLHPAPTLNTALPLPSAEGEEAEGACVCVHKAVAESTCY
jgi:hypothetical protein